jgi:L-malate glycosyltransferase
MSEAPPIRVVMIVRLFAPWVGGMERQALLLARALERSGAASIRIVTGRWFRGTARDEVVEGIAVHRNHALWGMSGVRGGPTLGGYFFILTLIAHLWRTRRTYDVIHVHGLSYHAFASAIASKLTGRPLIVKLANAGPGSDLAKMREGRHLRGTSWMLPIVLHRARFVALNRLIAEELLEAGLTEERVVMIPNGVEVVPTGSPVRSGGHDGALRILYVGRLHAQKSLETLLAAMSMLDLGPDRPPAILDLVGEGPERSALEKRATELGLDERVVFHGERLDVSEFHAQADVFVLPSMAEGVSNALLEAMAAGLPAVVSDIPGNAQVLAEGGGLLFPAGDGRALAENLRRVLSNDEFRTEVGLAARRAAGRYTIDDVASRYRDLYEALVGRWSAVGRGTNGAER